MTSYTRSPKGSTAHCAEPGCSWFKTYFDLHHAKPKRCIAAVDRAISGLRSHAFNKHGKRPTLVVDKFAQSVRPVMR